MSNTGNRKVVVSFALVKAREKNLGKIIRNLNNQTKKPDEIHVYISKEPFYLDEGFDKKPTINCLRTKIHFVPNTGALRKFMPILRKYWNEPEQIIILTDDDHIWHDETIQTLLRWEKKLDGVIATAGNFYVNDNPNSWVKKWFHGDGLSKPVRCDIISTGYCCLIKPKYFTEEIFNWQQYDEYGVPYDDEFWFNLILAENNVARWVVPVKSKRTKLDHYGIDMFKSNKSRHTKAEITRNFKKIIMSTGAGV